MRGKKKGVTLNLKKYFTFVLARLRPITIRSCCSHRKFSGRAGRSRQKRPFRSQRRHGSSTGRGPDPTCRRQPGAHGSTARCRRTWHRRSRKTCPIWSRSRSRRPAWPRCRCRRHPRRHRTPERHRSSCQRHRKKHRSCCSHRVRSHRSHRSHRSSCWHHRHRTVQRRQLCRKRRHRRHRGPVPRPEHRSGRHPCCPIRRRTQQRRTWRRCCRKRSTP